MATNAKAEDQNIDPIHFSGASPCLSDPVTLARSQELTSSFSTHSLPTLAIPWGGVPHPSVTYNEMESRCVHGSARSSCSVLHLMGPGAVETLQQNDFFIRNNSWPKKVCPPKPVHRYSDVSGRPAANWIGRLDSPQEFTCSPPSVAGGSNLKRVCNEHHSYPIIENGDSHSPFQSVTQLHNGQAVTSLNSNSRYFHKPMNRSSLNILTAQHLSARESPSNLSLDEISFRMYDRFQTSTPNLSTNSPLIQLKHTHRLEGVEGKQFKSRMTQLETWFIEFSDVQRNVVLRKLFPHFTPAQIQLLLINMEPFMDAFCMHNCQGILFWLPRDISLKILTYLDPHSLSQCSRVCRSWYHLVGSSELWENLCQREEWQFSPGEEKFLSRSFLINQKLIDWQRQFKERYRLKRNWRKGRYSVRTFSIQNSQMQEEAVSCIQFDEVRIVSGSTNKIKVWDMHTNSELACFTLLGHSGVVRCLHLFGNRLISGSSDKTIRIWDLTSNREWSKATCRKTLTGHSHTVRCLDADADYMVSGSYDTSLKVWSISEEKCLQTLRGHQEPVLSVKFNQDRIVSGSKDCSIRIWDWVGNCLHTLHGHQGAVTCLHFDRKRIISGSLDSHLKIWDMNSLQCTRTVDWISSEGHRGVIRHLQADNWKIVSAADDRTLKVWNLEGERILTLHGHTDGVTCLHFNDRMIVSGSYDKTVRLWDFSAC